MYRTVDIPTLNLNDQALRRRARFVVKTLSLFDLTPSSAVDEEWEHAAWLREMGQLRLLETAFDVSLMAFTASSSPLQLVVVVVVVVVSSSSSSSSL